MNGCWLIKGVLLTVFVVGCVGTGCATRDDMEDAALQDSGASARLGAHGGESQIGGVGCDVKSTAREGWVFGWRDDSALGGYSVAEESDDGSGFVIQSDNQEITFIVRTGYWLDVVCDAEANIPIHEKRVRQNAVRLFMDRWGGNEEGVAQEVQAEIEDLGGENLVDIYRQILDGGIYKRDIQLVNHGEITPVRASVLLSTVLAMDRAWTGLDDAFVSSVNWVESDLGDGNSVLLLGASRPFLRNHFGGNIRVHAIVFDEDNRPFASVIVSQKQVNSNGVLVDLAEVVRCFVSPMHPAQG